MTDQIIPVQLIERRIYFVRGQKIILDADLAELYGVTTGNLNKAVKRNLRRFPADFMFKLTADETKSLLFQIGRPKGRGGRQTLPHAFTEQGVAMLSTVLSSDQAIDVNIAIMRAFVHLREMVATHKDLALKLEEMEKKYDSQFQAVFTAIRELMSEPEPEPKQVGFLPEGKGKKP